MRLHEDELSCIRVDHEGHIYFAFTVPTDEFWMMPNQLIVIAFKLVIYRIFNPLNVVKEFVKCLITDPIGAYRAKALRNGKT